MKWTALAALALVAWCSGTARADTLPLASPLPATYTPGTSFSFTISVPQLQNFVGYTLNLVFTTSVTDPPLVAFPTVAPPDTYVFSTSANFSFQFNAQPNSNSVGLTLTDSIAPGTTFTTPGVNDQIATITVVPGAAMTGPITISVGNGTAFNGDPPEGVGYDPLTNIGTVQGPPLDGGGGGGGGGTSPVPAPPGLVLLGVGGLLFSARARFGRRAS
jgi:hypothetical protein